MADITITQVVRITRRITIEVEDAKAAIKALQIGEFDLPPEEDFRVVAEDIMNESYEVL